MNLKFRSCLRLSFMSVTESLFPDPEDQLMRAPFHRICCLMRKSKAASFLIHDRVEQDSSFAKYYPAVFAEIRDLEQQFPKMKMTATQVSFFSRRIPKSALKIPSSVKSEHVLGTCILLTPIWPKVSKSTAQNVCPRTFMFEAVVTYPSGLSSGRRQSLLNNYYHIGSPTTVRIAGRQFVIEGSYFCQQNTATSVCAHSSLKMALWYLGNGGYQPSTSKMNQVVAQHRKSCLTAARARSRADVAEGLYLDDIQAICSQHNASTLILDCRKHKKIPPYEYAYLLVESGIPTIVAFAADGDNQVCHVLPIIGHTMNSDEWFPIAINFYRLPEGGLRGPNDRYLSSSEWAAHLIVHDDLLGPYMCLDVDALMRESSTKRYPAGRIRYVIGITSAGKRIPSPPFVAQQAAIRYFWGGWAQHVAECIEPWRGRLGRVLAEDGEDARQLVARTLVVHREEYLYHLKGATDHLAFKSDLTPKDLARLERRLPERFWMTELSLPELHSTNRSKFGEIVLPLELPRAVLEARNHTAPPPVLFRVLNHLDLYDDKPIHLGFRSHIPVFRRQSIGVEF